MAQKIFGLIFAIIGVGVLLWGYNTYKQSQASKEWPVAAGKVLSSKVEDFQTDAGSGSSRRTVTMYRPKILYEYMVKGTKYTSSTIAFGGYRFDRSDDAQGIADKYPLHKQIDVYYDPNKPAVALFEPGKAQNIFVPFVAGGMFVIAGLVMVVSKAHR